MGVGLSGPVARLEGMDPRMSVETLPPRDHTREAALAALAALASRDAPLPQEAKRSLAEWCETGEAPPPLPDLVARPCPIAAALWHLQHLDEPGDDAATVARRACHARLLGWCLAPDRPEFRPRVTILIPVYNRAAMLVEAVQSCVAQDWRPLEILIVDDGSTDDPATGLQRFGDIVRVAHKPNGGVASARNAGLAAATCDFIHFLDSDDLLEPEPVSSNLAAFRPVRDAELGF